jgi:hypothetical protein
MYKSLFVLLLSLSCLGTAEADKSSPTSVPTPVRGPHFAAPEIDPASVGGAIALLIGGLAVLRGRLPKQ